MIPDMWHLSSLQSQKSYQRHHAKQYSGCYGRGKGGLGYDGVDGVQGTSVGLMKCSQFNNNYWGKLGRFEGMIYQKVLNFTLSHK